MNNSHKLSRRGELHMSVVAAGSIALAACGGSSTENPAAQKSHEQVQFNAPPTAAPTRAGKSPRGRTSRPITGTIQGTSTPTSMFPPPMPKSFKESPVLKEMVSSGKLPKLDERLPKNLMVLQPLESVGSYGGTWNMVITGGTKATLWTTNRCLIHATVRGLMSKFLPMVSLLMTWLGYASCTTFACQ